MATKKRATTRRPSSARDQPPNAGGLAEYDRKRNFEETPEPRAQAPEAAEARSFHSRKAPVKKSARGWRPAPSETAAQAEAAAGAERARVATDPPPPRFVIQKHDARRLHYDVRLEHEGRLVSWAVPKGPSYDPKVKRLAVHVEDHPLDYASFEGRIPEGNYGAGDVLVWDAGRFELPPKGLDFGAMMKKGHVHVLLHGDKLKGGWHFVRTRDDKTWLFFKAEDAYANPGLDITRDRPESIVSGHVATRGPARAAARPEEGLDARGLARRVGEQARAVSSRLLASPSDYEFEIKFDGYRLLVVKVGGDVRIQSRNGHDWTERFPTLADATRRLPCHDAVLDGEACVTDEEGRPSFQALQRHLAGDATAGPLVFPAFDLLWLEGRDLRPLPLEERRRLLESLLDAAAPPLRFSRSIVGAFHDVVAAARTAGLEGLIAKRKGSPYTSGPTTSWIKIKFELRQDVVVVGYTPLTGTNVVGALVVGLYEPDGTFVYAGKIGTGLSDALRASLAKELDAARIDRCPFARDPRIAGARYARPVRVVEMGLREWTPDGSPRFPRFIAFREDKEPRECVREDASAFVDVRDAPRAKSGTGAAKGAVAPAPRSPVKLSNPDKVLYPRDGITKRDVFAYYTDIAPVLLPHLRGRPIHMQRWPDGIDAEEWFQHAAPPKPPPFVRLLPFERDPDRAFEKGARFKVRIVPENVETLQYLANLAALTLHQRSAHLRPGSETDEAMAADLAMPDYVVIDLDPGDGTFADLIRVALAVRVLLDALELESLVKTSGQRGLHILVPLGPGHTHEQATAFAVDVARAVAKVCPDLATTETRKDKRGGRLYVDALQNGRGRTIVAPYSLRARDAAPVSAPLLWSEVSESLDLTSFNLRTMRARVDKHGDLLSPLLRGRGILPKVR